MTKLTAYELQTTQHEPPVIGLMTEEEAFRFALNTEGCHGIREMGKPQRDSRVAYRAVGVARLIAQYVISAEEAKARGDIGLLLVMGRQGYSHVARTESNALVPVWDGDRVSTRTGEQLFPRPR